MTHPQEQNSEWIEHDGKGIPADIVKAADGAAASCFSGTSIKSKQGKLAIAKAIYAERERCENLARRYSEGYAKALGMYGSADKDSGRGRQEGHINAGREIADLIRISAFLPAAPKGE